MNVSDTSTFGFLKATIAHTRGKRYILTEKMMGLEPEGVKERDLLCVLLECSVLVVLRPPQDNSGKDCFVGEAYVHGAMDGEVINELETVTYG